MSKTVQFLYDLGTYTRALDRESRIRNKGLLGIYYQARQKAMVKKLNKISNELARSHAFQV